MTKEIAAVTNTEKQIYALAGGKSYQDTDFQLMDQAIENLARHTGELTKEERISANQLIQAFQNRVLDSIDERSYKLREFYSILGTEPTAPYSGIKAAAYCNYHDAFEQLLQQTPELEPYVDEFRDITNEIEAILNYENSQKSELLIDKVNTPEIKIRQLKAKERIKNLQTQQEAAKRKFKVRQKWYAWKKKLDAEKTFITFLKHLDNQRMVAKTTQSVVAEKCMMAQMNVLIASEDVRSALYDLHTFAKTLNDETV